jgi:hypothetical protein
VAGKSRGARLSVLHREEFGGISRVNKGIDMKIYISGQITGLPTEVAKNNFKEAEQSILHSGWLPINPFSINPGTDDPTWDDFMVADIRELFKCDGIYMLKGWQNSKGARIEHAIAKEMGIRIIYEE